MTRSRRLLLIHPGIYDHVNPLSFPPWGVLCVGEMARRSGWDPLVVDLNGLDPGASTLALVQDWEPSVVAFTGKVGNAARRMIEAIAAVSGAYPKAKIAVGGPLVSSFPDPAHPIWAKVDALFAGDGEEAFVSWLAAGCPPNSTIPRPAEVSDLDVVGIPSWWDGLDSYVQPASSWPNMNVPAIHISAARGCTGRCTFCYLNAHRPSRRHRVLSPHRLIHELETLSTRLNVNGFYFVDDCLIDYPPVSMLETCRLLMSLGSPYRFGCDIQLAELEDLELLTAMHQAGFRCLYVGIEAASVAVRGRLGKRRTHEAVALTVQRAIDLGFAIRASIGIGWPGEDEQEVAATLDLVDAVPALAFDAYRYMPLPNVPLTTLWSRSNPSRESAIASPALAFTDYSTNNPNFSDLPDERFEELWAELQRREAERLNLYFGHRLDR